MGCGASTAAKVDQPPAVVEKKQTQQLLAVVTGDRPPAGVEKKQTPEQFQQCVAEATKMLWKAAEAEALAGHPTVLSLLLQAADISDAIPGHELPPMTHAFIEGDGQELAPEHSAERIIRAWYGKPGMEWGSTDGADVTDPVKKALRSGEKVKACNQWGDPCPGEGKKLLIEVEAPAKPMALEAASLLKTAVDAAASVGSHVDARSLLLRAAEMSDQRRGEAPRALVLTFVEGDGQELAPEHSAELIIRAWYGKPGMEWGNKEGVDVTDLLKKALRSGEKVKACNQWGDPCPGEGKKLLIEVGAPDALVGPGPELHSLGEKSFADVFEALEVQNFVENAKTTWGNDKWVTVWNFTEGQGIRRPALKGCNIGKTAEMAISLPQLRAVYLHIARWCASEAWRDFQGKLLAPENVVLHDACKNVIKPATEKRRCSFVELVSAGPQPPDWFVSHFWGEAVREFIACLEQHRFDYNLDQYTFYWVCAYANNQWDLGGDVTRDPAQSSFFQAMEIAHERGGGTLSVVDKDAVCFSRIWCDYEVATSMQRDHLYELYTAFEHNLENLMDTGITVPRLAVGITSRPTSIDGGHNIYKTNREAVFPAALLEKAITLRLEHGHSSVEDDRIHILNSIVGAADLDDAPPIQHPEFDKLNRLLHGKIACNTILQAVESGTRLQSWLTAMNKSEALEIGIVLSNSKQVCGDALAAQIVASLPPTLKKLHIGTFKALLEMPDISHLPELEELCINFCDDLAKLPDFSALTKLRRLDLGALLSLDHLPTGLQKLESLEYLNISRLRFSSLPEELCGLPALRELQTSLPCPDAKPEWLAELEKKGLEVHWK